MKIDINNTELKEFNGFSIKVLPQHAPKNQKYIKPMILIILKKPFKKKFMHRSRLRNNFLREREQMNLRLPITNNEISE